MKKTIEGISMSAAVLKSGRVENSIALIDGSEYNYL